MMKRVLANVLVLLCMAVVQSTAATPFEGKVVYNVTTQGESMDMTIYAKGKKSKMELATQAQNMSVIMDWDEQKMYMVMDEQKMVMRMSMDAAEGVEKKAAKKGKHTGNKLEKTGKTKDILGYSCEQWIAHGDNGELVEFWGSTEAGAFSGFMGRGPMTGKLDLPDMEEFAEMKEMFPMMVLVKDKSGKEVIRMEATAIAKTSIDASMFAVPTGYHVMEMPKGMGKMMQGGDGEE